MRRYVSLERDGAATPLSLLRLLALVLATSEFKLVLNWNVNRRHIRTFAFPCGPPANASLDKKKCP